MTLGVTLLPLAVWDHFGRHFGAQKLHFFGVFWGRFLDQFLNSVWTTFGAILGAILGPDRPKKAPKWAQEGHQELERPQKPAFAKTLKIVKFLRFLGSKGLPKEP